MKAVNSMVIPISIQEQLDLLTSNIRGIKLNILANSKNSIKSALINKGYVIEDNDPSSGS